ncbi:putative F-box protein PP2-B8 [Selaginella moellendorffii]|uniref:putative F-box protein PP2-B8 n=1 Tax=Selaginella moellendorffii TaxID=88036 RepID=UPI000D1C61C1|nr:putative F-box protein PP2-B8 [Selaginella moellendorffii]|eukprot:XP_024541840.1 putative F-box protein PP2-B8 [Selaginella moellendorffii]
MGRGAGNRNLKSAMPGALDLPESIIASILSHTSPGDVARLALVNRAFRDAGRTDIVWERMLPVGYHRFLKLAISSIGGGGSSSKRELYEQLCGHILIGDGSEGLWIDRATAAVCHSFSSRSLAVTWGSTAEYWEWSSKHGASEIQLGNSRRKGDELFVLPGGLRGAGSKQQ